MLLRLLRQAFGKRSGALEAAPEAGLARARALERDKALSAAIEIHEMLLVRHPADMRVHAALANCLAQLGRITEATPHYRQSAPPGEPAAYAAVLGSLNYDPDLTPDRVFEEHRAWGLRTGGLARDPATFPNDRDPERRLRVGYVSPDFVRHPVTHLFAPALDHHDRERFEITCYHNLAREDDMTARLKARADRWRNVAGLPDDAFCTHVAADRIDILVDLAGHTTRSRLVAFARRPAPVQASWLGYFNTTGLPAIDWFVTDVHSSPPGQERWFTERLERLPETRFCYEPPASAPAAGAPPLHTRGHVTFGCFNNVGKLNAPVLHAWARIMAALPGSRLEIRSIGLADAANVERLRASFAGAGIDPARVSLRAYVAQSALLAAYNGIDVALDPFPFGGGLTSLEALWMGVPVVTLEQPMIPGRQTLCFLRNLDLGELVARNTDAYVDIARGLAADPARLAELRATLRARMQRSPLTDAPRFARNLEAAYRRMWRAWTAAAPAPSRGPTAEARVHPPRDASSRNEGAAPYSD